jgi:hypothetical protein|eukprot:SAG25_NODE_1590_length_2721_cov_2.485889_4_plen_61_part_00
MMTRPWLVSHARKVELHPLRFGLRRPVARSVEALFALSLLSRSWWESCHAVVRSSGEGLP